MNWQIMGYVAVAAVIASVLWAIDEPGPMGEPFKTVTSAVCGLIWPVVLALAVIAVALYTLTLPARLFRRLSKRTAKQEAENG